MSYFFWNLLLIDNHGYKKAKKNLQESLQKLGLAYVDLYLIHTPNPGRNIETWKAFVELKKEGYVKSIGVSNYNSQHLEGLKTSGLETPVVNQIEYHPWYQQVRVVLFFSDKLFFFLILFFFSVSFVWLIEASPNEIYYYT